MSTNPYLPAPTPKRPLWQSAAMYTGGFVLLLWVVEVVDVLSGSRVETAGINPRTSDGLWGVLFAPVLHDDWAHLIANTVPIAVLGFLVLLSGIGRGLAATGVIWVIAGVGTWLIGGSNSNHIGASSLVFGFLAYLLVRGFFTRNLGQLAIGVVVFVLYGSALWGVLPSTPGVSWQGHLFGAVGGVVAAWLLSADARNARKQRSVGTSRQ
ncbi:MULTISPECIES: rhomboid family intramembrane serine protease [Nocardiaceae]|jgi:membrane associated rhomboid family serine protease|uniref:rhomboid family intramembrane serine protease n=1 Tax=Nocardiaceae TaxID=85025 RepID=UPI000561B2DC|nr:MULTISPECIES: rhomboid family intramembrane serine protease [Rhodococcus]OZE96363.1 rhomboid family intramembrane serine protease [Rhodococcus sp. 15-1189-1-1a]OZF10952.1 rhomboid family intramembrane serine protease [Rhodococcus sp. 14-2686-1-2]OZF47700.1 rhomboid family intramembrane serine protease [Rhodococcus sp. 14-2470-1b]